MDNELFDAIVELKEKDALRTVKDISSGDDPIAVAELCRGNVRGR